MTKLNYNFIIKAEAAEVAIQNNKLNEHLLHDMLAMENSESEGASSFTTLSTVLVSLAAGGIVYKTVFDKSSDFKQTIKYEAIEYLQHVNLLIKDNKLIKFKDNNELKTFLEGNDTNTLNYMLNDYFMIKKYETYGISFKEEGFDDSVLSPNIQKLLKEYMELRNQLNEKMVKINKIEAAAAEAAETEAVETEELKKLKEEVNKLSEKNEEKYKEILNNHESINGINILLSVMYKKINIIADDFKIKLSINKYLSQNYTRQFVKDMNIDEILFNKLIGKEVSGEDEKPELPKSQLGATS